MSLTVWDNYIITGKDILKIVEEEHEAAEKWRKTWNKFRKEYGFINEVTQYWDGERRIYGLIFDKDVVPDPKVWKRANTDPYKSYWPRKNTKEGKALAKIFEPVRKYTYERTKAAVGYSHLYIDNRFFPFNFFHYSKNNVTGFRVPHLDEERREKQPDKAKEWYKPVKGVKLVSYKKLKDLVGEELE